MTIESRGLLSGMAALITGAGGGIGQAVAEAFAKEGARLCLADLAPPDVVAASIRDTGGTALALSVDVTRHDQVAAMAEKTVSAFSGIDILVNVAGVVSFGSAEALAEAEWDRVIDINLKGTFLCCQAVIPAMRQARFGRIINLGSIVGKNGGNARPWIDRGEQSKAGNVVYGVSKAGVHAMTVFLARELAADGITVNAIAPGPIASAMTSSFPERLRALIPVGRMGKGEDVAKAAVFLAGRDAGFVTAEILDVNGGMWGD